jgi:single-strand DNA-binding protein
MNSIVISGRLTRRPELKQTKTNKYMSDFSIAVNRGTKNEDGDYEVDYINCRCWNKTAENLCNYQDKGDLIIVEGSIRVENYTDKDGNNKYATYVLANNIEYTSKKQVSEKQEAQALAQNSINNWDSGKEIVIDPDELPFY